MRSARATKASPVAVTRAQSLHTAAGTHRGNGASRAPQRAPVFPKAHPVVTALRTKATAADFVLTFVIMM